MLIRAFVKTMMYFFKVFKVQKTAIVFSVYTGNFRLVLNVIKENIATCIYLLSTRGIWML